MILQKENDSIMFDSVMQIIRFDSFQCDQLLTVNFDSAHLLNP